MPKNTLWKFVLLLAIIQSSYPQRRIKDGFEVTSDKKYMVYLLNAPSAPVKYEFWTCGGALVTPSYIITSAACVRDVRFLYAVAGYKKFVDFKQLDTDDCLKHKKKKVVMICVPKNYQFEYNKTENWAGIDIAVVQVETPFNLNDTGFTQHCSYMPELIAINYEAKYQQEGTDTMALGWGHVSEYRKDNNLTNMNSETLNYAPTKIMPKETCLKYFEGNPNMAPIISKYMICTFERGNLNDNGEIIARSRPDVQGCITNVQRMAGVIGELCVHNNDYDSDPSYDANAELEMLEDARRDGDLTLLEETRRNLAKRPLWGKRMRQRYPAQRRSPRRQAKPPAKPVVTKAPPPKPVATTKPAPPTTKPAPPTTKPAPPTTTPAPPTQPAQPVESAQQAEQLAEGQESVDTSPGICQNDHGGPLVTWVGSHEVLIGVATMFLLDQTLKCMGPYLFTSTQCNSAFLDCIITMKDADITRRQHNPRCETMKQQGFDVATRRISWFGHPDGPAENEMIDERPQIPMSYFNTKG